MSDDSLHLMLTSINTSPILTLQICEEEIGHLNTLLSETSGESKIRESFESFCNKTRTGFTTFFQNWLDEGEHPELMTAIDRLVALIERFLDQLDSNPIPYLDVAPYSIYKQNIHTRLDVLRTLLEKGIEQSSEVLSKRLQLLFEVEASTSKRIPIWSQVCASDISPLESEIDEEQAMWLFGASEWLRKCMLLMTHDLMSEAGPWAESFEEHRRLAKYLENRGDVVRKELVSRMQFSERELRDMHMSWDFVFENKIREILNDLTNFSGEKTESGCENAIRRSSENAVDCYREVSAISTRLSHFLDMSRRLIVRRPLGELLNSSLSSAILHQDNATEWSPPNYFSPSESLVDEVFRLEVPTISVEFDLWKKNVPYENHEEFEKLREYTLTTYTREKIAAEISQAVEGAFASAIYELDLTKTGKCILATKKQFDVSVAFLVAGDLGWNTQHSNIILPLILKELVCCVKQKPLIRPWGIVSWNEEEGQILGISWNSEDRRSL